MFHFTMNMPIALMAFYGSIMILAVLLLRCLLKNRLPKYVFPALWGVVLLRLLVPFSLSSPLSAPVPDFSLPLYQENIALLSAGTEGTSVIEDVTIHSQPQAQAETAVIYAYDAGSGNFSFFLRRSLPAAYLLGILFTAGILGFRKYCCTRRLRNRLLLEHNETVNTLLRSMGMGHILVFTNDEIASPLVCGLLNPRIYLPTRMDFGNTSLLRHILAHETMHIRRRDNWLKAVMLAALCLNWYNPLVWLMSKCLSSDLEAACDEAVLRRYDEEERKHYALSLLAMAITGNRATLLYSAFSRTEVERRIQAILHYKKVPTALLLFSALFLTASTMVFATGGQAPFTSRLTSFCSSGYSKWGVQADITRNIALGKNPQERAEDVIFSVLREDETENPEILDAALKAALAKEFGVEQSAFRLTIRLCLTEEELAQEYKSWNIILQKDGTYLYQGEQVRIYQDKILGSYQSREKGTVDISVERNSLGEITGITELRKGDSEFDRRSDEIERSRMRQSVLTQDSEASEAVVIEGTDSQTCCW